MERILRRNINKYLKSIKRNMILVNRETKIFLRNLKEEIDLFVQANKATDIAEIRRHFGSAKEIALEFRKDDDIQQLKKKARTVTVVKVAIITAAVVLVLWASGIIISDIIFSSKGYDVITVTTIP